MKSSGFYNGLLTRILILLALLGWSSFLISQGLHYNTALAVLLIAIVVAETYFFIRNRLLFYDKTIQSILQNDFSAGLPEDYRNGGYKNLFLLYETIKKKQLEELSREQIYQSILNNVDTAILILHKEESDWEVFLMNDYFSKFFGVPKIKNWEYLKNYMPSLHAEIEKTGFSELKTSLNITVENKEMQTFMLQTSVTRSLNQDYFIVLLDSIQRVIEKKEKEAWVNLMKIISHELMNSLTPIRSLSQSIGELVKQETLSEDDLQDIRFGLSTIVNRSDHLQFFVENYRKLTILPTPEKTEIDIKTLFSECVLIMSPLLKQESITVHNHITNPQLINADKNQLEQVIINLLTNSIHALKDREEKSIFISMQREGNRLFLTISDNGKGIETAIRDKIFLPFFTTRKDGAGIGLTLSKNIIEAHGGYLSYETEEDKTRFVICLIDG